MENKNFKDLKLWQEARSLVKDVYEATKGFPASEKYCLGIQMRKAAISVPSNIAEGIGRNTNNDTLQFLYISRGSIYELETQLYLAEDLTFINAQTRQILCDKITLVNKMLSGFITYKSSKKPSMH